VVYVINDCLDREKDRLHPAKAGRPIASGRLKVETALTYAAFLGLAALVAAFLLQPSIFVQLKPELPGGDSGAHIWYPSFFIIALLYLLLITLYSLHLKHVVVLDVLLIAVGFVLRAVAGGVVIKVSISPWLFICTIFLSIFLALCKRRHELMFLVNEEKNHRRTLSDYNFPLLDQMIAVVSASCLMSYALYTTSVQTVHKFESFNLVLTIPFVIYGLFRYLYIVYKKEEGGDPSQQLFTDRPLLICIFLWALASMAAIYLEAL
jgi:4-hydroxybenzoate polyprenyltransferase